jgi:membrane protein
MSLSPKSLWRLFRNAAADWSEDKAPQLGAALAFYSALSIAPLLVILLGVVAFFYGDNAAEGQITKELSTLVGPDGG